MSVIKNLKFSWPGGSNLLDIEHWELPDAGLSAIMGPSGCGKSTLLRCLIGLEACSGQWMQNGKDLMEQSVPHRNFAAVFQSLDLFPHMTAQQNIMFSAESRGIAKNKAQQNFEQLVNVLNLSSCLSHKGRQLSGGEAQRVAVARALICKPTRLFLDEPFSSLDADIKKQARQLIKQSIAEFKIPTLMITHDHEDIRLMADHKFLFKDKTIKAFDIKPKI